MEVIKSALLSIWSNKIRSLLTVLGIVIGVSSVTILVSLGQGLKDEVSDLIRGFGSNLIFVTAGKIDTENTTAMSGANPANFLAGDILTVKDIEEINKIDGVLEVSPMSLVAGSASYKKQPITAAIAGTYSNFDKAFDLLQVKEGTLFKSNSEGNVAVIGPQTKELVFADREAVGETMIINGVDFKIIGVFDEVKASSIFGSEFGNLVVIPFDAAIKLNKNKVNINRIVVKAADDANVPKVKEDIFNSMLELRDGEENFTVLTQDDILSLFDQFLSLATTLVSAIAAISLIVGGIGIMNIMLVTVTERTKEIGLRKAVGATKLDIGAQFLIEAVFITLIGGLLGLLISFGVSLIVATNTPLTPSITPEVILAAIGVSTVVGIIFGLWPALRAAQKDPIEALRYE